MAQDKAVDTEKYAGSGRVVSALGSFSLWAVPSVLIGGIFSIPLLKSAHIAEDVSQLKGKALATVGGIAALGGLAYGTFSGWRNAAKGKAQFEELKSQNQQKEQAIGGLQTQVVGLQQEVGAHRSFAEQHAKKQPIGFHVPEPHGNHAEKHASHAEHASHADAVRASQAEAAQAGHVIH